MRYRRWSRLAGRTLLVAATLGLWLACGGGGGLTAPTTGVIALTTSTTGDTPDPDGYTLTLDGGAVQTIGASATASLPDLTPGSHEIGLTGLADNCVVQGDNPRSLDVVAGETTAETMVVVCTGITPGTGDLAVTVATTGVDADPDGYTVSVDGDAGRAIAVDGSVTVTALSVGDHLVGLAGVAANCTVAGDNPRTVAVPGGAVADAGFSVACSALPAATGTLTITTTTSGPGLDPDGYAFAIGDGEAQPIGTAATVSVANVAAGVTSVELSGLAANCEVGGQNPRDAVVPADGTVDVAFTVTCAAGTGSLEIRTVSTGSPGDPSGYTVRVDGEAALAIGANATRTVDGLTPGSHAVLLGGIADNCAVDGENPLSVTVTASQTATVSFAVTCAAVTGALTVTVNGLPSGADAAVTVSGPGGFSQELVASGTLDGLAPGDYTVAAATVAAGATSYAPSPATREVTVARGATATATVTYAPVATPTLNVWIPGLNITQSVQTFAGEVPLVAGRDGFLRVFVRASESNTVAPTVRVRLFDDGNLVRTLSIDAPSGSVPLRREDGTLNSTWNIPIPADLIRPGLAILADVDPDNVVAEEDETDNAFPTTGTPLALTVRNVPALALTLVPVRQSANQLQGDVTTANRNGYVDFAQRVYPLPGYDADVHPLYTTTTSQPLQSDDANGAWNTVLSEIAALRAAEGSNRTYYGVVRTGFTSGLVGRGFIGFPAAIGYDEPGDRARIAAHELGHTWDRLHAPCGNPEDVDGQYPYPNATIGVFGFDVEAQELKQPDTPDLMGYCADPWISDYTYRGVMTFRGTALGREATERAVPSLLVWGRIERGRVVLEPAFHLVTRPALPARPGAYTLEGTATDGGRVFSLSFDPVAVADDGRGGQAFAFAVPLDEVAAARVARVRLAGPGGSVTVGGAMPAQTRAPGPTSASAVRVGAGIALRWDAASHPMVMVRDCTHRCGPVLRPGRQRRPAPRRGRPGAGDVRRRAQPLGHRAGALVTGRLGGA